MQQFKIANETQFYKFPDLTKKNFHSLVGTHKVHSCHELELTKLSWQ